MHFLSKTIFGYFFILSPLSLAIAAENTVKLPTINTVANLTAQENSKTLAAVTVIDREEIELKQFNSLQDLLRTIPSVSFNNTGGQGKTTGISIRGTNSNAVLVLVDGQRLGSATTGTTAFEHLPIDQIERVEVVRGPRSSLYGSDAIGGVIQIYTRKGSQNGAKPFASFTYGAHETYDANVGVDLRNDQSWASLSVAGLHTQGIDATDSVSEADHDGYKNYSVSLKAGHQVTDQLAVDMNFLRVDGKTQIDNTWTPNTSPFTNIEQNVYGIGLDYQQSDLWNSKLKIGFSEDSQDNYTKAGLNNVFNTRKETLSWLNTLKFNESNSLNLGFDYLNDKVSGSGVKDFTEKSRDNLGYFAQYLGQFGNFDVQGAIRIDDNEQFGDHTTGNATLGYDFNPFLQAYVSYSMGFRAPTFNELYYPESYGSGGNIDLKPEESENYEIGLKGNVLSANWAINAFQNNIDNMIVGWTPYNIAEARVRGIELTLGQSLEHLSWNMNYTYQDPENRSEGINKGKQITYKPTQLFNLSAGYRLDKWTVGASVHGEDKRYITASNRTDPYNPKAYLGSFVITDARVSYQATPEFSIQAKLANMFDKQYQTNYGYDQDGRTAWVTLRYAMK